MKRVSQTVTKSIYPKARRYREKRKSTVERGIAKEAIPVTLKPDRDHLPSPISPRNTYPVSRSNPPLSTSFVPSAFARTRARRLNRRSPPSLAPRIPHRSDGHDMLTEGFGVADS